VGSFFGSIQVKADDQGAVVAVVRSLAKERGISGFVGPCIKGWVGVYPENHGQDEGLGQALAERIGGTAIQIIVHDEDVLAYWLWRDGALVDSYWSKPGYFGDDDLDKEEAMRGNPVALAEATGARADAIAAALTRPGDYTFESMRLERLGYLLGISNLATSYEYLKEEDGGAVRQRRKFVEVSSLPPVDVKAERAAIRKRLREVQKRAKEAVQRAKSEATRQGWLVAEVRVPQSIGGAAPRILRVHDGFVLVRTGTEGTPATLTHFRPHLRTADDLPISLDQLISAVATDTTGTRIIMISVSRLLVWDLLQSKLVAEFPHSEWREGLQLSPDGTVLRKATRLGVLVLDSPAGPLGVQGMTPAAGVHPSGKWRAKANDARITIEDRDTDRVHVEISLGEGGNRPANYAETLRTRYAGMNLEAWVKRWEEEFQVNGMTVAIQSSSPAKWMEDAESHIKYHIEPMRANLEAAIGGSAGWQPSYDEQARAVGFSRDGQWMWCGTTHGVWVCLSRSLRPEPEVWESTGPT
jgi:hypothetical protein